MSRYNLKKSPHDEGAVREKIAQGFYTFSITDYKDKDKENNYFNTKNNDPRIMLICEVVSEGPELGNSMAHNLIFYRPDSPSIKGIGITRHFLKCIKEPFEGDLEINPDSWIGKQFSAEIIHNGNYANLVEIQEGGVQPAPVGQTAAAIKPEDVAWDE